MIGLVSNLLLSAMFFHHPADPIVDNMLINMFFDFFQLIIHCNFLKDLG